ncbi:hypothetical protein BVC80_8919g18 [Macleaya cordata]|uniref:Glycoside hydrolase n=1 Tax=Macleaya cordata TaxID=56857 RepID=A0A200Q8D6_MACCD|nr:hypothetical protein BVC80_8919g18 [Macleaya cordata]
MGIVDLLFFVFLVVLVDSLARSEAVELKSRDSAETVLLNRSSFPTGFIFGTASSSYQVLCSLHRFMHLRTFLMKVQPMKMVEGQVFGILSLTNFQDRISRDTTWVRASTVVC